MNSNSEYFSCPYCGQENSVFIDCYGPSRQSLVVDCEVCCRPILIRVKLRGEEIIEFSAQPENE